MYSIAAFGPGMLYLSFRALVCPIGVTESLALQRALQMPKTLIVVVWQTCEVQNRCYICDHAIVPLVYWYAGLKLQVFQGEVRDKPGSLMYASSLRKKKEEKHLCVCEYIPSCDCLTR